MCVCEGGRHTCRFSAGAGAGAVESLERKEEGCEVCGVLRVWRRRRKGESGVGVAQFVICGEKVGVC